MSDEPFRHEEPSKVEMVIPLGFWLTSLTIYLRVIYPIYAVLTYFSWYGSFTAYGLWMGYVSIELVGLLAMSALALSAGYFLRNERVKASKKYAIYILVIIGPVWQTIESLVIPLIAFGSRNNFETSSMRVVLSLLFASGWIAYLVFSKKTALIYR